MRENRFSSMDLVEAVLRRAAQTEAELHGFLTLEHDRAMARAEEIDQRRQAGEDLGPLMGVPIALKDNLCTDGTETTCGSQILSGYRPPYNATVINKLREAGAITVGKTNLDEFAMGSSTENSAYGPTRNPWNTDRVPGGSSGGSAAVVAAGSALGALGSDTGGSIRQPAALTGVVGMKPTYGLVSRYGLVAFASSLDQIGPLTKTVEDASLLLETIWGPDPRDATSWSGEYPQLTDQFHDGVEGMRIGQVAEMSGEGYEPEVLAAFERMLGKLEAEGARISEFSLPSLDAALSTYYLIGSAEASANLARFDGVRYGLRVLGENTEEMMTRTRSEGFGPEVLRRILLGTYALSAGYYDAFYGQAHKVRSVIISEFQQAYQQVDVLVSPTSPTVAFPFGYRMENPLTMYLSDICTLPANLAGHPSISVPIGVSQDHLPIGFQVMAPSLGEATLFRVAQAVERLAEWREMPPMVSNLS